jgi:hypothetical protein
MIGERCLAPVGIFSVGALMLLLILAWFASQPAATQANQRRTVSPLPASDYAVRAVCPAPARGHVGCLALELVPRSPAARAHTHPLGRPRRAPLVVGKATKVCEPPKASENCYGLRPQDLHSAYRLPTTSASPQTIALVDAYDDPTAEADLKVYDEEFNLPACTTANGCFTKVNEKGKSGPLPEAEGGWAEEISLDIEVAHAICQNCHILLVEAGDTTYLSLEAAEETAVKLGANEISNSWSGAEPVTDSSVFDHPGTVVTAASGDEGYLNWQSQNMDDRGTVGYPASSPHVVAVGGTRLSIADEGAWVGETVWNGDGATGGGCSEHYEAPLWQRSLANWSTVGCGSMRAVADVSADADPYTGVAFYDSTTIVEEGGEYGPIGWGTVGGTSLASPLIAATFALAGGAGGVEYPAQTLYENELKAPGSLHDVEIGSSGECLKSFDYETGLSGCTALEEAESSCSRDAICLAGPGYDGPSGVGSPDELAAFQLAGAPVKKTQSIEFTSNAPSLAAVDGPTYAPVARASSGLPVELSSGTPWVCALVESTVSFLGAGTCTIDADQAGNQAYDAAPQAQQSFSVAKGSQSVEFTSNVPGSATVGGPVYPPAAAASSGLPVSFSSATPSVCSLEGSTVSFVAVGTCTVEANQDGNSNYEAASQVEQSFSVSKGSQHIVFSSIPPSAAALGDPSYLVSATASSGLSVAFSSGAPSVCSLEGQTVSFVGAGTCTIDANQAGSDDYDAAPRAQQSFTVEKASQLVDFTSSPPASMTVGATYVVAATASSGLPVAFSSAAPSVCLVEGSTVSFVGAGTCTIEAEQAGDPEYDAAPETQQSFTVGRRSQLIEILSTPPSAAQVGGLTYGIGATATSGLTVLLTSATPSVCALEGSTVSFIGVGTCTIDAEQPGNGEYEAAPRAQQSFAVGAPPVLISTSPSTPNPMPLSALPSTLVPVPDSDFVLLSGPTIDTKTGAVTFTVSVVDPGRLGVLLTFPNGKFGAFASTRKCKPGQVRLKGRCRPAKIDFGWNAVAVSVAGSVSISVTPGASAKRALEQARRRHRSLHVTARLTFQSSLGGSPMTDELPISVSLAEGRR